MVVPTSRSQAADGPLEAGVATVDITPEPGLTLWGYSNRDARGDRHARSADGQGGCAAFGRPLGGDRLARSWAARPRTRCWKKFASEPRSECGIDNLFITASHTHHAPAMESAPDSPNPYADKVGDAIAEIICAAAKDTVPVRIGVGRGTADFAHNRRKFLSDGRVAMQWRNAEREPTEPVDREYATIRLDRADGSVLAVLFNYACHPVVMGPDNYQYSADFVGSACAVVEEKLKTKCLFLQGGCGNHQPLHGQDAAGPRAASRKCGRWAAAWASCWPRRPRDTKTAVPAHPSIKFEARQIPVRFRWDLQDPQVREVLSKAYGPRFDNYLAKTIKNNMLLVHADDAGDRRRPGAGRHAGRDLRAVSDGPQDSARRSPTRFWSATRSAITPTFPRFATPRPAATAARRPPMSSPAPASG